jgi:membrane protein YdbS with pleckstrin-like domain
MSEIETDNPEKTLWLGTVSQWHYAGKWFVIILLLAAAAATFFFKISDNDTIAWSIRGVLVLAVVVLFIWIRFDRASRKYTVTSKRVSVEFGIVSKQSNEMRIQDIRSINLTTKGFSGLLGIGRLEFSSAAADDADVVFWNTPNAEKIRDMVRSLQS